MKNYKKINDRTLRQMILGSLGNCCEESAKTSEPERKRSKKIYEKSEIIERPGSLVKVIGYLSPSFLA